MRVEVLPPVTNALPNTNNKLLAKEFAPKSGLSQQGTSTATYDSSERYRTCMSADQGSDKSLSSPPSSISSAGVWM